MRASSCTPFAEPRGGFACAFVVFAFLFVGCLFVCAVSRPWCRCTGHASRRWPGLFARPRYVVPPARAGGQGHGRYACGSASLLSQRHESVTPPDIVILQADISV